MPGFIAHVTGILGEHPVELSTGPDAGALFDTPLEWRSRQYSTDLLSTTEQLKSPKTWEALAPLDHRDTWSMSATRAGSLRHHVWRLHIAKAYPWCPGHFEFQIAVRHLSDQDFLQLGSFVHAFFARCGAAGAFYGRGGFTKVQDAVYLVADQPQWESHAARQVWERSAPSIRPVVPGVYQFNYFDASRVKQVDMERIVAGVARARYAMTVQSAAEGAVITMGDARPDILSFLGRDRRDPWIEFSDTPYEEGCLWLLSHLSRANMLAVQHMEWMADVPAQAERERLEHEARQRKESSSVGGEDPVRCDFSKLPPTFIAPVAAADCAANLPAFQGRPATNLTVFALNAPGSPSGITLQGKAKSQEATLESPIRAGSLKPGRALFEFDSLRHGWDGEHRGGPLRPIKRTLTQFRCPTCDGRHFALHAIFEYPDDPEDLEDHQKSHAQDFFTWFWLHARCTACNWCGLAADIECA